VNTAALASLIAREYDIPTGGKEYTAGLLHDMGKIVMVQCFPTEMEKVSQAISEAHQQDVQAETEIVGIAHTDVGALLGEKWRLPVEFVEVMKYHHDPRSAAPYPELTAVVRFADLLAESWGMGIGERAETKSIDGDQSFEMLAEEESRIKAQGLEGVIARLSEKFTEQKSLIGML
jgi:HD-like signal output (HDOD) protein